MDERLDIVLVVGVDIRVLNVSVRDAPKVIPGAAISVLGLIPSTLNLFNEALTPAVVAESFPKPVDPFSILSLHSSDIS